MHKEQHLVETVHRCLLIYVVYHIGDHTIHTPLGPYQGRWHISCGMWRRR
jgi:hypothetical protein